MIKLVTEEVAFAWMVIWWTHVCFVNLKYVTVQKIVLFCVVLSVVVAFYYGSIVSSMDEERDPAC